jgi:hypothetical protein
MPARGCKKSAQQADYARLQGSRGEAGSILQQTLDSTMNLLTTALSGAGTIRAITGSASSREIGIQPGRDANPLFWYLALSAGGAILSPVLEWRQRGGR